MCEGMGGNLMVFLFVLRGNIEAIDKYKDGVDVNKHLDSYGLLGEYMYI